MPGTFEKFPFTNFHGLNLDWIIQKMIEIDEYFHEHLEETVDAAIDTLQISGTYDALTETLTLSLERVIS